LVEELAGVDGFGEDGLVAFGVEGFGDGENIEDFRRECRR